MSLPYLSPKERVRIAKKERMEASEDTTFQRYMAEGERLFRERDYPAALSQFKNAREKRPFNVNAKVKIEDVEALIAKEDPAGQSPSESVSEVAVVNDTPLVSEEATPAPIRHADPVSAEPTPKVEVQERSIEQGQAFIVERTLSSGEKNTVYRKVEYKWGGTYYFKNAKSITQREYEDTFEDIK